MSSISLGWGIVGTGRIAEGHIAPAIADLPGCTLAAVVSRDRDRAAAFAARHGGGSAFDDYDRMLADPAVNAVYIATPNAHHAGQVISAARAGKHVLCDKPLAVSVEDAQRAVDECARAGVRLGVTFQSRFHEGMAEIRRLVTGGEIGSIVTAHVEMSSGRTLLKGWRTDPGLAGVGTINNIGVHAYDLLRYLLGAEIIEVSAMLSSEPGFRLETTALALLRFDSGAIASVQVNQTVPGHRPDLVVYGTAGRVVGTNITRPGLLGTLSMIRGEDEEARRQVSSKDAYRRTMDAFTGAVLNGRDPSPSGTDGLVSVRVTHALERAAREGRTIQVNS